MATSAPPPHSPSPPPSRLGDSHTPPPLPRPPTPTSSCATPPPHSPTPPPPNTAPPLADDPFYDPHADSEDEAWVQSHLLPHVTAPGSTESISCPACFTLLSHQVQPHVRYEGQFRAVFVTNCKVVQDERLRIVVGDGVGGRRNVLGGGKEDEAFRPVACAECGTEVGVLDNENVYHFCNVVY
eukprot:GFKZ01012622.1.p2 GENE.GFKZ01012622.1~~GFKZ01012622.1.p2  ORF type:complete len:202 (-),score=21.69 GFKZ01012622.1:1318-1866(-)